MSWMWITAALTLPLLNTPGSTPSSCPTGQLPDFGDEETREQNRSEREARLVSLTAHETAGGSMIDVIYEGEPFGQPERAQLRGLVIEDVRRATDGPEAGELVAVVALEHAPGASLADDEADGTACPTRHTVRVDDEVVPGVPVRAVVDDGLLIESDGGLYFAPVADRDVPTFRLIWRSSYSIYFAEPQKPTPPKRPKRRSKRGRRR